MEPNTCLISNGFASMGIALHGSIGAKMLYPEKRVLSINGDGGFLMNAQELETAVRCKVPVVALIWTDRTYGLIRWKQIASVSSKSARFRFRTFATFPTTSANNSKRSRMRSMWFTYTSTWMCSNPTRYQAIA